MCTSFHRSSIGLGILRVVVGAVFIAHGAQKLFVFGHTGTTGAFTRMGVPLPVVSSEFVGILEFFGGIALLLRLFTSILGALFAIEMLTAIVLVHAKNGFFSPGVEYPLTLVASSLALALAGPGAAAADNLIAARRAPARDVT